MALLCNTSPELKAGVKSLHDCYIIEFRICYKSCVWYDMGAHPWVYRASTAKRFTDYKYKIII